MLGKLIVICQGLPFGIVFLSGRMHVSIYVHVNNKIKLYLFIGYISLSYQYKSRVLKILRKLTVIAYHQAGQHPYHFNHSITHGMMQKNIYILLANLFSVSLFFFSNFNIQNKINSTIKYISDYHLQGQRLNSLLHSLPDQPKVALILLLNVRQLLHPKNNHIFFFLSHGIKSVTWD